MLITELKVCDSVERVHNYSDAKKKVVREDGIMLDEAWDVIGTDHRYSESDIDITDVIDKATEDDKDAALRRFGVEVKS